MIRVLLSLLLLCSAVLAGERPPGFLGINWGASPEEAKRVLQARPGVKFPEETDDFKFELTGGTFAGKAVHKWILEFPERKFASAVVILKSEGPAADLYKDFRTQLGVKYGPASTDKKLAKASKSSSGERVNLLGNVATWKFGPNMQYRGTVSIVCELSGSNGAPTADAAELSVTIRYLNDTLLAAAAPAADAKPRSTAVKREEL